MTVCDDLYLPGAACRDADPDLFLNPAPLMPGVRRRGYDWAPARRICASCPVREQCLDAALDRREPVGMWAGTTPAERRKILQARDQQQPAQRCVVCAAVFTPHGHYRGVVLYCTASCRNRAYRARRNEAA